MTEDFNGKVVVVTGGSSGIGLACVKSFLRCGARVVIAARNEQNGQAAVHMLSAFGEVSFISTDVTQPTECDRTISETIRQHRQLDVLVNSAGIYLEKSLTEISHEEYRIVMDSNIGGTFFMSKAALPYLRERKGCIVNVSSDAGLNGNINCTAYCASKGAVTLFTKALAIEVALSGVRVNCVCPGDIETRMWSQQMDANSDPERFRKQVESLYPIGRIGTPDEVAKVILFLASGASSFVTGAAWTVDGGLTAL